MKTIVLPKIFPVTCHTDYIGENSTFVAIKGAQLDGIKFIPTALARGAKKIVIQENDIIPENILSEVQKVNAEIIKVKNCRQALSNLSAQALNYPAKKLRIIGITGTKGKTTSTFVMRHILSTAGYKTAMISGVYNMILDEILPAQLTTPHPDYIQNFLSTCVENGVEFVVMEASAQGLTLNRLDDVLFDGIIFTNLDLEHSEFYNTIEDYFAAKLEIFNKLKPGVPAIVNIDNKWAKKASELNVNAKKLSAIIDADYKISDRVEKMPGVEFSINGIKFNSNYLVGNFNIYNLAGVISLALELGLPQDKIKDAIETFKNVPGRMEQYTLKNGAVAIIDYAHTPESFTQVLSTIRKNAKNLIVLFGAGGGRAKDKRPIMGNIAANFADKLIVTADNPRTEDVNDIIKQIIAGVSDKDINKVESDSDRENAIKKAYNYSNSDTVIVLLGKGPEEYQIIGTQKVYFSDKKAILSAQESKNIEF